MPSLSFGPATARDLTRETLLTDGLGGFALTTLAGVPTRSYSGLAVSGNPPVQRWLMWIAALETLEVNGQRRTLHALETAPGTFEGDGLNCLEGVELPQLLPERRQFALGRRVTRRAVMPRHSGALVLLYETEGREAATFTLGGVFTDRDIHAVHQETPELSLSGEDLRATLSGSRQLRLRLVAPRLTVQTLSPVLAPQRLHYRAEAERGEASTDHAVRAELWRLELPPGRSRFALVVDGLGQADLDPWAARRAEVARRAGLVARARDASGVRDDVVATLALAADAFLVRRASLNSTSVIAGYPWFADWGRDSLIALSGLTLATGRFEEARAVLGTFLRSARRGLVPNNFWDDGSGAGYNTVDGGLWLVVAFERFVNATGDLGFARKHLGELRELLEALPSGTDYGVRLAENGLLRAGEVGAQLTWMDVKIHDWVVTPRHGQPVEIAALWLAALGAYDRLTAKLGRREVFGNLRLQGEAAFAQFWQGRPYPHDVLTDDGTPDPSVRPNALLALALSAPRTKEQEDAALRVVEGQLLTPLGLRTLSPLDPRYRGEFGGHRYLRDSAYHQGTVWPWLIGAYVDVLLSRGEREEARAALRPLVAHLSEAGVGSVSEVFGGNDLKAGGCPFQAWSVAELLRAYVKVHREE